MTVVRGARALTAGAVFVFASAIAWTGAAHADCPASDPNCMGGVSPSPSPTPSASPAPTAPPVNRGVSPATVAPSARQAPAPQSQPGTNFFQPSTDPGTDFAPGLAPAPTNTPNVQLAGNAVPAGGGTAGLVGPPTTSSGGSAAPIAAAALGLLGLGAAVAATATKKKPPPPPPLPNPECVNCGRTARQLARQIEFWKDQQAAYEYGVASGKLAPYKWVEALNAEHLLGREEGAKLNDARFAQLNCGVNAFLFGIDDDPGYKGAGGVSYARTGGMHWVGDHWEDYRWPGYAFGDGGVEPL